MTELLFSCAVRRNRYNIMGVGGKGRALALSCCSMCLVFSFNILYILCYLSCGLYIFGVIYLVFSMFYIFKKKYFLFLVGSAAYFDRHL